MVWWKRILFVRDCTFKHIECSMWHLFGILCYEPWDAPIHCCLDQWTCALLSHCKQKEDRGACHLHQWLLLWFFQLVNLSVIKGDLKIKHCKAFPKLTVGCFTQQDEENPLQTTRGIFFFFPSFYFPLNLQELIKQPIFLKPTRDIGLAEVSHCKKCQT